MTDANDMERLKPPVGFLAVGDRPTMIIVHSHIGYGALQAGSPEAHGEPLGEDEVG